MPPKKGKKAAKKSSAGKKAGAKKTAKATAAKKGAARPAKQEEVKITVPKGSGPPKVDKDSVTLQEGDAVVFDSLYAGWKVELKLKKGQESPFRRGKKLFKGPQPKGVVVKGATAGTYEYKVTVPGRPVLDPDIIIEPKGGGLKT